MNKKFFIVLVLIGIVVSIVFAGGSAEDTADSDSTKTIVVGTEGVYKPFSYHDDSGALVGYDVDVVRAVAEELGYAIEFAESRWDALLAGISSGRWDVVANQVWWNEQRANDFSLSEPYMDAGAAILVSKDSTFQTVDVLAGKRAAVSLTSAYRPLVEELTKNTVHQDDFVLTVKLLVSGRIDFLVNDTQAIGRYLFENPDEPIRAIKWSEAGSHKVVFALGKDNTELTTKIDAALKTLYANGTIDSINRKYFVAIE